MESPAPTRAHTDNTGPATPPTSKASLSRIDRTRSACDAEVALPGEFRALNLRHDLVPRSSSTLAAGTAGRIGDVTFWHYRDLKQPGVRQSCRPYTEVM